MTTLYTLHWTDNPPARSLAATDSDRLQPVVYHGLQSGAPFEVRQGKRVVAQWRGAGPVEYLEKDNANANNPLLA